MATITTVKLVDDLDGQAADETVTFGLDGKTYEIDMSDAHAAALRALLAPYVAKARPLTPRAPARRPAAARTTPAGAAHPAAVRAWARETGRPVSTRGRISATVVDAYLAAHS